MYKMKIKMTLKLIAIIIFFLIFSITEAGTSTLNNPTDPTQKQERIENTFFNTFKSGTVNPLHLITKKAGNFNFDVKITENDDMQYVFYGSELYDANNENKGYFWSPSIGWINFNSIKDKPIKLNPVNQDEEKKCGSDFFLDGYAWNENVGWVKMTELDEDEPDTDSNIETHLKWIKNEGIWKIIAGEDDATTTNTGNAWNDNIGWIDLKEIWTNWQNRDCSLLVDVEDIQNISKGQKKEIKITGISKNCGCENCGTKNDNLDEDGNLITEKITKFKTIIIKVVDSSGEESKIKCENDCVLNFSEGPEKVFSDLTWNSVETDSDANGKIIVDNNNNRVYFKASENESYRVIVDLQPECWTKDESGVFVATENIKFTTTSMEVAYAKSGASISGGIISSREAKDDSAENLDNQVNDGLNESKEAITKKISAVTESAEYTKSDIFEIEIYDGTFPGSNVQSSANLSFFERIVDKDSTAVKHTNGKYFLEGDLIISNEEESDLNDYHYYDFARGEYIKDKGVIFDNMIGENGEIATTVEKQETKIIVVKGNIYIKSSLAYKNETDASVIFIALQTENATGDKMTGGNLFIDPNVTNIVGTYYLDGSIMSAKDGIMREGGAGEICNIEKYGNCNDSITCNQCGSKKNIIEECEVIDGFTKIKGLSIDESRSKLLKNQLLWEGKIVSKNTIGGAMGINPKFPKVDNDDKEKYLYGYDDAKNKVKMAQKYDLNELRMFAINNEIGDEYGDFKVTVENGGEVIAGGAKKAKFEILNPSSKVNQNIESGTTANLAGILKVVQNPLKITKKLGLSKITTQLLVFDDNDGTQSTAKISEIIFENNNCSYNDGNVCFKLDDTNATETFKEIESGGDGTSTSAMFEIYTRKIRKAYGPIYSNDEFMENKNQIEYYFGDALDLCQAAIKGDDKKYSAKHGRKANTVWKNVTSDVNENSYHYNNDKKMEVGKTTWGQNANDDMYAYFIKGEPYDYNKHFTQSDSNNVAPFIFTYDAKDILLGTELESPIDDTIHFVPFVGQ